MLCFDDEVKGAQIIMLVYAFALVLIVVALVSKFKAQDLEWLFTKSGYDMDKILTYTLRD